MNIKFFLAIFFLAILFSLFLLISKKFLFFHTKESFEIKILQLFQNIVDNFKSYLRIALTYSIDRVIDISAKKGGLITKEPQVWYWIYCGPNIPSFEKIKRCGELNLNYSLNIYISNYKIELPLSLSTQNVTDCLFNLTEADVEKGFHDEGYYFVQCGNTSIKIEIKDKLSSIENIGEIKEFLMNNRFWYIYRKVKEWALEEGSKFASCICECTPEGCHGFQQPCECVEKCAEKAFNALKQKFKDDKYISCDMSEIYSECSRGDLCHQCNVTGNCINEPSCEICKPPSECYFWEDFKRIPKKNLECAILRQASSTCKKLECKWYWGRAGGNFVISCLDNKYFISQFGSPQPLEFNVGLFCALKSCVCLSSSCKEYC